LKKKLEEVKKKIEEAKKKKLAEASASGKGIVGEVKEETKAEGELPAWFKEIYKASKELEKRGLLG
jgi:benzoyl-CoA reductase/2-hydroxyglutaryl-CoA dehydratase subunit BcrC/BadD/HgdB